MGTDFVITEAVNHAANAGIVKAGGQVIAVHEQKDSGRPGGLLPISSDHDQFYFTGDVCDPAISLDDYEDQYFGVKENVERAERPRERESLVTAHSASTRVSEDHCQFCDLVLRSYEFASCENCWQIGCSGTVFVVVSAQTVLPVKFRKSPRQTVPRQLDAAHNGKDGSKI